MVFLSGLCYFYGYRQQIFYMTACFREVLWKNFGAAIDMLSEAVRMCPETLWLRQDKFYYLSFHTAIFLDYYLANPVAGFKPVLPYKLTNPDELPPYAIDDVLPVRFYSRKEIRDGLGLIREKGRLRVLSAGEQTFVKPWIQPEEIAMHLGCPALVENYSVLEILFYNLRHVQHHTAQLNLLLRQETGRAPEWISHAD